jgi:hypothetical protein
MMEIIKYKNITFRYHEVWAVDITGATNRENGIGFTLIDEIPEKHIIGMKRDGYYSEYAYGNNILRIPPHCQIENYRDSGYFKSVNSSIEDSDNVDLHIVYIKWMLSHPRKQFEIDISCENPYWIFHDICHIDDVQGAEVCCLSGIREDMVLTEALELMVKSGYTPDFSEEYLSLMNDSHYNRWKRRLPEEFYKYALQEETYEE